MSKQCYRSFVFKVKTVNDRYIGTRLMKNFKGMTNFVHLVFYRISYNNPVN